VDPRFTDGNEGVHGLLYLDGELLQRYLKHANSRTEQEVYVWMMTSEMGFPVTQDSGEVQCWRDIVEDRPVPRFLAPVITDYIRKTQDKSIGREGSHGLFPELETLDREWSQGGCQTSNHHGRKRCLTGVSFTPYVADLNVTEHNESKKSLQGNWEQTSVSRWKDSPDPLPDTNIVMYPVRIVKGEQIGVTGSTRGVPESQDGL
jgi:hypothetical protein